MNLTKKQRTVGLISGLILLFAIVSVGSYYLDVAESQTKGEVQYRCANSNCSCHSDRNPSYGDGHTCCSNCKKSINE